MYDPCAPNQKPHHRIIGRIRHYPANHPKHPYHHIIGCKKMAGPITLLGTLQLAAIPILGVSGVAGATYEGYNYDNYYYGTYSGSYSAVNYVCTKYTHDHKKCDHVVPVSVPEPSSLILLLPLFVFFATTAKFFKRV
jgi:hypothetical protein